MSTTASGVALPDALRRVEALDPELHRALTDDFTRLARVGSALAWAQKRLPELLTAGNAAGVLGVVVDEARALTGAPSVWALAWSGDLSGRRASFRSFAGVDAEALPAPTEISNSVVAQVASSGQPVWSDDASADARFTAAQSVQAFALRSVGCVPIGPRAVLYLQDPDNPGRFSADDRFRLAALCRLAGSVLGASSRPARQRPVQPVPGIVGSAPVMDEVFAGIRAFAAMPWPVLVLGESGTGKELVARALHDLSPRADRPFVALNCGAIPEELAESTLFGHERGAFTGADRRKEGMVERVRGGTLFLDEVGELAPRLQVKLLRLLQEGDFERVGGERPMPFQGRVVAATLRDLDDAESRGTFREDLYFRLAACVLRVPPLRERRDDVGDLAQHLLDRALSQLPGSPRLVLTEAAVRELRGRSWPGNVRELENVLRTAIAYAVGRAADAIDVAHLGPGSSRGADTALSLDGEDLQAATERFQRRMVETALSACEGNRTKAAERLGVSRQWLHRLLTRWDAP